MRKLRSLLKLLNEQGISYYKSGDLEIVLGGTIPNPQVAIEEATNSIPEKERNDFAFRLLEARRKSTVS